jgi:hypothetical protein
MSFIGQNKMPIKHVVYSLENTKPLINDNYPFTFMFPTAHNPC